MGVHAVSEIPGDRPLPGFLARNVCRAEPGPMLVELSLVEQRYHAVMEVVAAQVPITEVAARYGVHRELGARTGGSPRGARAVRARRPLAPITRTSLAAGLRHRSLMCELCRAIHAGDRGGSPRARAQGHRPGCRRAPPGRSSRGRRCCPFAQDVRLMEPFQIRRA
jgi:hypothetical protein